MWEFNAHEWNRLRGFRDSGRVLPALERLWRTSEEDEWQMALQSLELYATDLGLPSETTQDVVACLVPLVLRAEGKKRSAILSTLEELTCGRGIEEYSSDELEWHRASVRELAWALHTWSYLAEAGSTRDATLSMQLLAYCGVYVPELEHRVRKYFVQCAVDRPALKDEISALIENSNAVKLVLAGRQTRPGIDAKS